MARVFICGAHGCAVGSDDPATWADECEARQAKREGRRCECRRCTARFYAAHCSACDLPLPAAPIVCHAPGDETNVVRFCDAACEARWHESMDGTWPRVWANRREPAATTILRHENKRLAAINARLAKRVAELEAKLRGPR